MRFRGLSALHCHSVLVSGFSVLHCHGVLVLRKAVFSTGFSTTGKGWEKAILFDFVAFPSITAIVFWFGGGLFSAPESVQREKVGKRLFLIGFDSFWVRFRGLSVLHCHGVLVWRRAVFSTGVSTTGKSWEKAIFRSVLVWRKAVFSTGFNTTGKGWESAIFYRVREFCGAISWLVRPLHCHGVLVWRRAVFSTGFNTTGKGWESAIFYRVREFFGAISWLVRPLHCHGVLVWRRAVFSTGFSTTGKGWFFFVVCPWEKAFFS